MQIINFERNNNKEMKGGIICFTDGTFEAFTMTQAKKYKTLRGAKNFMAKNDFIEVEEVIEAAETPEMEANFEAAEKWLGYVKEYKDMKYYGEAQVYYTRYKKAGGKKLIEYLECPERYKELLEEPVEELTFEEKAEKAAEIINKDFEAGLSGEDIADLYIAGAKLYGNEFEKNVLNSAYMLATNTIKNFVNKTMILNDDVFNILLTSPLNKKPIKKLRELCKENISKKYNFDEMRKWQLVILLQYWIEEADEAGTIEDIKVCIATDTNKQVKKVERLIDAINNVCPLLDELNEAMEEIMNDADCNEFGVASMIKDYYTNITCSGFLEDFESVARVDLKELKRG